MLKQAVEFTRVFFALNLITALTLFPTLSFAADGDPTGNWDIVVDMGGTPVPATLSVTKNDDGTYAGSLSSPLMGEAAVDSVTFSENNLGFTQTFGEGDEALTFTFTGILDGDTFQGILANDALGEMSVKGMRAGAGVFGTWTINSLSDEGEMEHTFIIKHDLTGSIDGQDVTNLTLTKDTLSFDFALKLESDTLALHIEGTTKSGKFVGKATNSGEALAELSGKMSKVAKGTGGPFGTWAFKTTSGEGEMSHTFILNSDLTATFDEVAVTKLILSKDEISCDFDFTLNGSIYNLSIEADIDGDTLSGEVLNNGVSTADLVGKLTPKAEAPTAE